MHRSKEVSLKRKCGWMASHVCSVATNVLVTGKVEESPRLGDSGDEEDLSFPEV